MQKQTDGREVVVLFHNHVDPVWARCFEENAYNGRFITRSYMDIFEWMVERFVELSEQGFCYSEGQTVFWETYLERNPEKAEAIKKLVREGKLEFLLQGFLTCDTNYVPAEGIIRNYLLALPFYEKYGEQIPVRQAFLWDAFGSSANLPQILKQFGADRVGGTKYRPCLEDHWTGIDGTSLPCIDRRLGSCNLEGRPLIYVCARHPHCPKCQGAGCEMCGGRGMRNAHPFRKDEIRKVLQDCAALGEEKSFVLIGGEEVIPDESIVEAVRELNREHEGRVRFRFGTLGQFWEEHRKAYETWDGNGEGERKDLNPVNQGGYLTRIENKQRVRRATYRLLAGEARYACSLFESGLPPRVCGDINRAWKDLLLNMHHDAISGTHIDSAQRELEGWLVRSEEIAGRYAPCGRPHRKEGRKRLLEGSGVYEKRLGRLKLKFDIRGILGVSSGKEDLFGTCFHEITAPRSGKEEVRIGELLLQDDIGDLYGTYLFGEFICLGRYHYCVMEEENAVIWRGIRTVGEPLAPSVEWETRVEPSEDGKRLNFTVRLKAKTANKRISVMIPVNDPHSGEADYEIPFGFIRRKYLTPEEAAQEIKPYYAPSLYERTAILPTGDYPALHWVHHEITEKTGVAVFNRGLPCNRYMPGCFILGLMRSPLQQGVTVMPHADEMWDIREAADTQEHLFEFSVYPHWEPVSSSELVKTGYQYNEAEIPVPFEVEGSAMVSAFKVAEDERGYILRIFETQGCESPVRIVYGENRSTTVVGADEKPAGRRETGKEFRYVLHRHEILSLRIE